MKSKKFKVGAVAMALVFAMSGSAFAANAPGGGPTPDYPGTPGDPEYQTNADTTISIFTSDQNAGNMSYTIPLYVTMGVSKGKAEVAVPTNYGITNTSTVTGKPADPNYEPMNIGVTSLTFDTLKGSTYKTVADAPSTTADGDMIQLKIGGILMPALDGPGKSQGITISAANGGVFWDGTGAKVKPIPATHKMFSVPIEGLVASSPTTPRPESKAVAQFRVRYNVSLLKKDGTPLGQTYAGSDYQKAGLTTAPTN